MASLLLHMTRGPRLLFEGMEEKHQRERSQKRSHNENDLKTSSETKSQKKMVWKTGQILYNCSNPQYTFPQIDSPWWEVTFVPWVCHCESLPSGAVAGESWGWCRLNHFITAHENTHSIQFSRVKGRRRIRGTWMSTLTAIISKMARQFATRFKETM